jgi:hypothetical protein
MHPFLGHFDLIGEEGGRSWKRGDRQEVLQFVELL